MYNHHKKVSSSYAAKLYIDELEKVQGVTLEEASIEFLKKFFNLKSDQTPGKNLYYDTLELYCAGHWKFYIKQKTKKSLERELLSHEVPTQIWELRQFMLDILLFGARKAFLKKVVVVCRARCYQRSFAQKLTNYLKNLLKAEKQ